MHLLSISSVCHISFIYWARDVEMKWSESFLALPINNAKLNGTRIRRKHSQNYPCLCSYQSTTYVIIGSGVLLTPAIECRSILAIDTLIDPRSTLDRHLGRPSVDTRSTSRSTDFQFLLTLYGVAIDTSDDHTLDVGRRVDRYLTVGYR